MPINFANRAEVIFEDGTKFVGSSWGAEGYAFGEGVFTTGMTGYQETITDPSYAGQILTFTTPHIGNTGLNLEDDESGRIWVSGLIVRDPSFESSSWRATTNLEERLKIDSVVGIKDVDTRAITQHLRHKGAMRIGIFSGESMLLSEEEKLRKVQLSPSMVGANLSEIVSTKKRYNYGKGLHKVAILDLGVKENTLKEFERVGFQSIVFPHNSSFEEIMQDSPDAFFISNGPGDPAAADGAVDLLQRVLSKKLPFFGICFGHQIFGRALGLNTTKLKFGHRGINQPVIDLQTKRVSITAHNHGFAVDSADSFDTPYGLGRVTHRCLNDDVVEGLALETQIAFSVQFHPEAAAGPHDSNSIFDQFANTVRSAGGKSA